MKTIGIFCGGFSSEWEISLKSAQTIQDNFPKEYATIKILVSKDEWNVQIENQSFPFDINTMSYHSEDTIKTIDAALVYIHGDPGENGKIQALLEMKNIPYINSGTLASALSFDKWYCNQFLKNFGIHVAESLFMSAIDQYNPEFIIDTLGLPLFIKPSDSGSSYGISKVKKENELFDALKNAFKEGKTVVAEAFLNGTEVTCGVYRSKKGIHALPLTEIVSENDFFDFEAKYKGKSDEITPAQVSDEIKENVQNTAKKIYSLLQLRSIARIDFMIVNSKPCVIEVNTTPGFSPASIVPKMLASAGISIETFWRDIVEVELVDSQGI
jgi:D-alanine-D-alanine ligase